MTTSGVGRARRFARRATREGLRVVLGPESTLRRNLPEPVKTRLRILRRRLPVRRVRAMDTGTGSTAPAPLDPAILAAASVRPAVPTEPVRVWVAPANVAGQGKAWAESLNTHVEGVGARSMAVLGDIRFDVDQEVAEEAYRDVGWQECQEKYVVDNYTHVLVEAGRPLFGTRYGGTCEVEIKRLREAGLRVGLISHGPDLRIPSMHAERCPHSPIDDREDQTFTNLDARGRDDARIVEEFDGPVFVSTPDLLDHAPQARWCPIVVDLAEWGSDWPLLTRRVPRVVHVPGDGKLKGSASIDEIMGRLATEGRIEYRRPRVTREDIKREVAEADIVIGGLLMGRYGVTAIEALASGRVVVAFLGDAVRKRIRDTTGSDVPIREATVETLREVVLDIVENRDEARAFADAGPEYVDRVHDGRMSARVLTALTGGRVTPPEHPLSERAVTSVLPVKPAPDLDAPARVFVGPANFAGQGTLWARALESNLEGVSARAMAARQPTLRFPTDYEVDPRVFSDVGWSERQERYLAEFYTHVLIEAMRPVTGYRRGVRASDEIPALRDDGLDVALIAHGTDVRIPSVHRATTRWSPFTDTWDAVPTVDVLEQRAQRNVDFMSAFDGPTFVSTPDLLDYVPDARWCPVVVDVDAWATPPDTPDERDVPLVVHAPSHSQLKGTALVEPRVKALAADGVIAYRRLTGIAPCDMPAEYRQADIVLDQFALGSYGVAACEAMAAGRVVIGHVTSAVRDRVRTATGFALPIVECEADHIDEMLRDLATERGRLREIGRAGVRFVRAVHDGRISAQVLGPWVCGHAGPANGNPSGVVDRPARG